MLAVVLALLAAAALALVIYFLSKGNNMSVHIGGRGPGNLDRIPLKPTGLGGNLSGITAPTLTLQTASGASPASWNVAGDSTFQPGMYVHQQFATNSGFTTGVTDYFTQIQGSDWEANSSSIGNGLVTFIQPTGTYYQRARFETTPGDSANNAVSPWSNTQTDTISGSTASLSSAAADKSSFIVLDTTHQAHASSDQNAQMMVRTTVAQANQKGHFELIINALDSQTGTPGSVAAGICDSSSVQNLSSSTTAPGSSIAGFTAIATNGRAFIDTKINGFGGNSFAIPSAPAVGDAIIFDHDYTAHTVHVRYYQAVGAVVTNIGTFTITSTIPVTPYPFAGVYHTVDQVTLNTGNASWLVTPDTGFTYAC